MPTDQKREENQKGKKEGSSKKGPPPSKKRPSTGPAYPPYPPSGPRDPTIYMSDPVPVESIAIPASKKITPWWKRSPSDNLDELLKEAGVVIFGYSDGTNSLSAQLSIKSFTKDYKIHFIDLLKDEKKKKKLSKQLKRRMKSHPPTLPAVFIGGKYVGDYDDIERLDKQHKLWPMIDDVISDSYKKIGNKRGQRPPRMTLEEALGDDF